MAFPVGTPVITLTGKLPSAVGGTAFTGRIILTPSATLIDAARSAIYPGGGTIDLDTNGAFTVQVIPDDADGIQPTGWKWHVDEQPVGGNRRTYWIDLPTAAGPTVDLSRVTEIPAPGGGAGGGGSSTPTGPAGGALAGSYPNPTLAAATTASFDPAGAATAAQAAAISAAAADASSKVAAHTVATDPHGDRADAATKYVPLTDARLTDSRTPTGSAGGALKGTYPNPQLADATAAAFDVAGAAATAQATAIAAIPSAATTVTAETAYGQASATGTAAAYARQDHTHGSPALTSTAPATAEGIGQAAAVGTATAPARADHVHPMAAAGAPAASAVTSTQTTGVASTFAASDHVHSREGFGAVTAQTAFAAASATGTALTVAHSDHAHGTPTLPIATVSAAGIVQLDGTAGDITALGTQAAGAIGKAADAGHVHPTTGVLPLAGGTMTGTTNATLASGTTVMDASLASGDTFDRYRRDTSGREERGSGSIARDTFWYRSGPGVMTTDGLIAVGGGDPTTANQLTRMAWVEAQNGWGLGDYIAAGSPIKAWTGSPGYTTSGAFTFGQIKLNKLWLRSGATLSTVTIFVTTAGVGLTSGQNLVAILDASGNQLAISVDQTTAWASTGPKPAAMTVPIANAAAGGYYVAVLCNGATSAISVTMHTNSNTSALNFGLTAANGRCLSSASSANTTIPASIALGSQTLAASNFMAVIT